MLETAERDPISRALAGMLVETYRTRSMTILGMRIPSTEKVKLLDHAREQLRTQLCDLLEPFDLDDQVTPTIRPDGTAKPINQNPEN